MNASRGSARDNNVMASFRSENMRSFSEECEEGVLDLLLPPEETIERAFRVRAFQSDCLGSVF